MILLLEVTWWAHRALWHLIFSGVLERHPDLQFVFTEQGTAWVPETLTRPSTTSTGACASSGGGSQEEEWGGDVVASLQLSPSEYWARQCHVGASFIRPTEVAAARRRRGRPHHVGQRLPAPRGELPVLSRGDAPGVRRRRPGRGAGDGRWNAARLYGFDVDALAPIVARVGPTVAEISEPLDAVPAGAERCPAFAPAPVAGAR